MVVNVVTGLNTLVIAGHCPAISSACRVPVGVILRLLPVLLMLVDAHVSAGH